jgi:F-type H+-transporting ATPase subunit epsilon
MAGTRSTFFLEIITPEKMRFNGDVSLLELPGVEGAMGILPHHAPILAMIRPGRLHYVYEGQDQYMAVGHGFVKVTRNRAVVLSEFAYDDEELDAALLSREKEAIEKEIALPGGMNDANRKRLEEVKAKLDTALRTKPS